MCSDVRMIGPENTEVHPSISTLRLCAPVSNPKSGLKLCALKTGTLKTRFCACCAVHIHATGGRSISARHIRDGWLVRKKTGHTCCNYCMLMSVKRSNQKKKGNKCSFYFFACFIQKWQQASGRRKKNKDNWLSNPWNLTLNFIPHYNLISV